MNPSSHTDFSLVCSRVSRYVAKHLSPKQGAWNEATQNRMTVITDVLNQAKTVRMAGLTRPFTTIISRLRDAEIETSKRLRWILVYYNASANALGIFSPVVVLVLYTILSDQQDGKGLDVKTAFTSTALLALVTHPANMIMTLVPRAVAAQVGFERIQSFLVGIDKLDDGNHPTYDPAEEKHITKSAIRLAQTTVGFHADLAPVLRNLDLEVKKGSTTLCVGVTGSGKSALVNAVRGDMVISQGRVEISSRRIAVCMQTPWLPNGSIKEAISGMLPHQHTDPEWYRTIVRACCLDIDFAALPDGDSTQIGYGGINLSGGQRQRVALARAILSRCEIIVLDDPFSALDHATEGCIIQNLLGADGLLRKHQVTTLLTASSARHTAAADQVILLQDGTAKPLASQSSIVEQILTATVMHFEESALVSEEKAQVARRVHSSVAPSVPDDASERGGDLRIYSYYLSAAGSSNALVLAACTAAYSFFVTFPQYWFKRWTENSNPAWSSFYIWGYFIISLIAWMSTNGTMWTIHLRVAPTSGTRLHNVLLKTVMGAVSSFFFEHDTAEAITRFGQDINLVDKEIAPALGALSNQMFKITMQMGLLLFVEPRIMILLPIVAGLVFILQRAYLQKSRQLRMLDLKHKAGVYSSFLETTEGLTTIRSFGWQDACAERHCRYLDDCQRPYYILMCLQRWLAIVMDLMASGIAVVVVALLVVFKDTVNGAEVGIAFNIILLTNTTLIRLVESWTNLELALGAVSRLKRFQEETLPEEQTPTDLEPPSSWPTEGAVTIRNIQVAYNSKSNAIEDFSLVVEGGRKVVVCGRTGSGKSTLLLSLLRVLDLQVGSVEVDGLDLATLNRQTVRERCFITLPQDPLNMPNLSLRLHVDPRETHSDDEIIEVLQVSRLWSLLADESQGHRHANESDRALLNRPMNSLPALSSGQMQLLSLARVALQSQESTQLGARPGPILLVDEATSSLDQGLELLALELIDRYFTRRGLTVIMVTHKVDTVKSMMRKERDLLVTMKGGRIQSVERYV